MAIIVFLNGCISFLLFDKVVRYGAGCLNPGYEAESDAEVRPVANLIRQRKKHHYGLGGFPHERLHQDNEAPLTHPTQLFYK
ncbi:hypothetical protein BJP34_20020 [Moorena producens PAL-8-15-08-1]|uniref:Uncharacterized protein n=1 Tax=Moorena producens PAL-8-15-08-1 TaxID=1458985 RepID=A0A1D8TV62_9CYAN|nr:hypothetical protein [Moorena producens]AOX01423.1 hypothetical protein BJP34_20020 [Moorena producens PAL-8-15-08-1]